MPRYFVSGHCNLSEDEFIEHYLPALRQAMADPSVTFVVGDAFGCDRYTLRTLLSECPKVEDRLVVFHLWLLPRYMLPERIVTQGRFKTDDERDAAMTAASDLDLAWVRPEEDRPDRISGTQKNLDRRKGMRV